MRGKHEDKKDERKWRRGKKSKGERGELMWGEGSGLGLTPTIHTLIKKRKGVFLGRWHRGLQAHTHTHTQTHLKLSHKI